MESGFLKEIGFPPQLEPRAFEGRGCKECGDTGFKGRLGIFELMMMDDDMRRLTIASTDATQLRKSAVANGMITLREDGFEKVSKGLTTVSEVLRVTQDI